MTTLPDFFTTQHQLRELAVLDHGAGSTLFLVEDPAQNQLLVELFSAEHRGVLREAGVAGQLQHSAIAPIVGTGTTTSGQEFFVRRCFPGEQLSNYTGSGVGARHLSREEALATFAPLADAVDFLLQRDRAGYALRALNPRRIILTSNRSTAFLATVGPDAAFTPSRASAQEVIGRLAHLLSAAYPTFRADAAYPSAAAVLEALRAQGSYHQAPQTAPQPAVHPAQQQPFHQPAQPEQPKQPKKKSSTKLLLGLGTGAVALLLIGGLLWFFIGRASWSEQEQALADAHPGLLSSRPGGEGFEGATCESRDPEEGQEAKITCIGDGVTYSVAGYGDVEKREAAGPAQGGQELSNGQCTVHSYDLSDAEPLYYMAAEDSDSAVLVWGENAEETRLRLPLC
ncbi:serine/threonine protein kinase [Corynebacterium minutissimum]|uniref:serine/threonine protein kinase n=1 Tax=Corynebacterium minutissimum TaxID=38301 RepID=UPI001EF3A2C2|nr:serine/threonine protein kinase [Corynebacterium minutissimum]MCG7238904.1 serine/threonine protein kinase [Corynebacterium minutissimum]